MATWQHEGVVELFRRAPELVVQLLERALGVAPPPFTEAKLEPASMAELQPAEIHADLVIVLWQGDRPVLAIVFEVQLREDADKLFAWPAYLAHLRRRLRCDVCLVVLTQRRRVARWAAKPISLGPGSRVTPLVLSPFNVPAVTRVEEAKAAPELAVLSSIVHGGSDPQVAVPIAIAAATAAHGLDRDRFLLYFGLIQTTLSAASQKVFRMESQRHLFFTEESRKQFERGVEKGIAQGVEKGIAQGVEKGIAQGVVRGKANSLITVLETRGLAVSQQDRERILATTDLDLLDRWTRMAVTVRATAELFA